MEVALLFSLAVTLGLYGIKQERRKKEKKKIVYMYNKDT